MKAERHHVSVIAIEPLLFNRLRPFGAERSGFVAFWQPAPVGAPQYGLGS